MIAKATSRVDGNGRIVIPAHIRNALALNTGDTVNIEQDRTGRIVVTAAAERCCVCGSQVKEAHSLGITIGPGTKYVCAPCSIAIRKASK